jgi:hypothetical protein
MFAISERFRAQRRFPQLSKRTLTRRPQCAQGRSASPRALSYNNVKDACTTPERVAIERGNRFLTDDGLMKGKHPGDEIDALRRKCRQLEEENGRLRSLLAERGIASGPVPKPTQRTIEPTLNKSRLSTPEKIALFRSLFRGREDAYMRRDGKVRTAAPAIHRTDGNLTMRHGRWQQVASHGRFLG